MTTPPTFPTPPTPSTPDNAAWLRMAQRVQALAQTGLAFEPNVYDGERYQELLALGQQMLHLLTGAPPALLREAVALDHGYATPKVDVRAVVLRAPDEILMVREKSDGGRWTVPGGWADVGYTPAEVAVKEMREETGLKVEPVRLLALWDKRQHPHPPQPWYIYKAFIQCRPTGGALLAETPETLDARWVKRTELPHLALSTDRVTLTQLERLLDLAARPDLGAAFD